MHRYRIHGKAILLSDPHGFHANIQLYSDRTQFMNEEDLDIYEEYKRTKQRPKRKLSAESVEKMTEFILDNINAEVNDPQYDTVLINGDLVFGNSPKQYRRNAEYFVNRIRCRDIRLVFGNHDDRDALYDLFSYCYDQAMLSLNGLKTVFSHYPMVTWEKAHHGVLHCYGHVHGLYKQEDHPHPMARPQLWAAKDIGVDTNNLKPYTVPVIMEEMKPVWLAQQKAKDAGCEHHMY